MSEFELAVDQLDDLTIRGTGNRWYNARGPVTKENVQELVEDDIIPTWRSMELSNEQIALGLALINVESGFNIYASNNPQTFARKNEIETNRNIMAEKENEINEQISNINNQINSNNLSLDTIMPLVNRTRVGVANKITEINNLEEELADLNLEEELGHLDNEEVRVAIVEGIQECIENIRRAAEERTTASDIILRYTSAKGLGQFVDNTWNSGVAEFNRNASAYGLSRVGEDCECDDINSQELVEYDSENTYTDEEEESYFKKNTRFCKTDQIRVLGHWIKNTLYNMVERSGYKALYEDNENIIKEDVIYGIHHSWNIPDVRTFLNGAYARSLQTTIRGDYNFWLEILKTEQAFVLYNLSSTAEDLIDKFYSEDEDYEIKEYEENIKSIDCSDLDDFDLTSVQRSEAREKIYISPNDAIYQELKDRFEDVYKSDYKEYLEAKTGKEIEIEYHDEAEENTNLLTALLENYHEQYEIFRQDDFDYFRVLDNEISLIDIINYIILRCKAEDEENYLKNLNNILEGIEWEDGQFSNIGQLDLSAENEENEENKYYMILKEFSNKREQIYSGSSYENVKNLNKKLILDFLAEQMGKNLENGFDSLSKDFIYWYHAEAEVSLPGEIYNELTGIDETYSILHMLNFIDGKNNSTNQMDELIADKTYEAYLEESFEEAETETIIENDKAILESKELIDKFDSNKNIKRFLEEIKNHSDMDPVEKIKEEANAQDRMIDNVSLAFLEQYNENYGIELNNENPVYYHTTKIIENNDLLVFSLMDKLVVDMEKEEEKAKDKDDELYVSIKEFKNNCKESLEEVITKMGSYEKIAYIDENDRDLSNFDLKQRLIAAFEPKKFNTPNTDNSLAFFESFMTEEDCEKEKAQEEAEKEEQLKEEREKTRREEEEMNQMYAKEEQKRKKDEEEKAKLRNGWIAIYENGSLVSNNRKDHYGA